jgi:hypothetical protein
MQRNLQFNLGSCNFKTGLNEEVCFEFDSVQYGAPLDRICSIYWFNQLRTACVPLTDMKNSLFPMCIFLCLVKQDLRQFFADVRGTNRCRTDHDEESRRLNNDIALANKPFGCEDSTVVDEGSRGDRHGRSARSPFAYTLASLKEQ